MKVKWSAFFFFIFFSPSLFAKIPFSVEISIPALPSLQIGKAYEYVFDIGSKQIKKGKYRLKSLLEWPLLPSTNTGFSADINIAEFHTFFSAQFSFPSRTGNLTDSDFFNKDFPKYKTHFSIHKAFLKKGTNLNTTIGWVIPLPVESTTIRKISIEPGLGFRYILYNWVATDGYLQYTPEPHNTQVTPQTPKKYFKGKAIEYSQMFFLPNISFFLTFELKNNWVIKNLIQVAPQIFAICIDNHFVRNIIFTDIFFSKGFSFHFNFLIEKQLTESLGLFFSAECSVVRSMNGTTVINDSGKIYAPSFLGHSGTALYSGDFSFGFRFRITNR